MNTINIIKGLNLNKQTNAIIGFDISTKAIGVCILGEDREVLFLHTLDLSKETDLFKKGDLFFSHLVQMRDWLDEEHINIGSVFIEEPLKMFAAGGSSASTLMTLARFNGMCSTFIRLAYEKFPAYVNVNSARAGLKIGTKKSDGKTAKDRALIYAKAIMGDKHDWTGTPLDNDAADALVIATYSLLAIQTVSSNESINV